MVCSAFEPLMRLKAETEANTPFLSSQTTTNIDDDDNCDKLKWCSNGSERPICV